MQKLSKEELEAMNLKFNKPRNSSHPLVDQVLSLEVDESVYASSEDLEGTSTTYLYIAMRNKGKKLRQKKVGEKAYVFTRIT